MATQAQLTIEDLYDVPEDRKAEIVHGEIVLMSPTGAAPNFAAGEIFASLRDHARRTGSGRAVTDNAAFKVDLPHRESLSPDAAFYIGSIPGMKFFESAPAFAAEVRSEHDYGPRAEKEIRKKRDDYFAAGTVVVWDVDLIGEDLIRVYRVGEPEEPTIYRRGEIAQAEPAVPGWKMPVDDLFG